MRLIDADAFLERMSRTDRFFSVVFDINDAPTVDAVPVVGAGNASTAGTCQTACVTCTRSLATMQEAIKARRCALSQMTIAVAERGRTDNETD